mmetsp:Transcript_5851/g.9745  ORF Transcript_5851/g.9745 Transcript_5851/m.9745 type:complete len:458 (+) Transcript_5851:56-1429(+)
MHAMEMPFAACVCLLLLLQISAVEPQGPTKVPDIAHIVQRALMRKEKLPAGVSDGASFGQKGDQQPCWEYLWIGHANSTVGPGVTTDLHSFASSVQRFTGRGDFVYYLDGNQGVDVGLVGHSDHEQLASSTTQTQPSNLVVKHGFPSLEEKGIHSLVSEAMKPIRQLDKTCELVASYSGHGYNFNGVGYQEHRFLPWEDLFDAIAAAFGGPVDLLTLNSCRTADYMTLAQVQGSAKMVLASQQTSVYGHVGSWAYGSIDTAKDALDFAKKTLHHSMPKQRSLASPRGAVSGISLIHMKGFSDFVRSFEILLHRLQRRMPEEISHLIQARRSTYELAGPTLYAPDNEGMMVDAGSLLKNLRAAFPPEKRKIQRLIGTAIQKLNEAVLDEEHFPPTAEESGLTLWFMKPHVNGWHRDLLRSIRQHFSRDVHRRWTSFLEAYYLQAEKATLTDADLHVTS